MKIDKIDLDVDWKLVAQQQSKEIDTARKNLSDKIQLLAEKNDEIETLKIKLSGKTQFDQVEVLEKEIERLKLIEEINSCDPTKCAICQERPADTGYDLMCCKECWEGDYQESLKLKLKQKDQLLKEMAEAIMKAMAIIGLTKSLRNDPFIKEAKEYMKQTLSKYKETFKT